MTQIGSLANLEAIWSQFLVLQEGAPTPNLSSAIVSASQAQGLDIDSKEVDDLLRVYQLRAFQDANQFYGFVALLAGDQTLRI